MHAPRDISPRGGARAIGAVTMRSWRQLARSAICWDRRFEQAFESGYHIDGMDRIDAAQIVLRGVMKAVGAEHADHSAIAGGDDILQLAGRALARLVGRLKTGDAAERRACLFHEGRGGYQKALWVGAWQRQQTPAYFVPIARGKSGAKV